MKNACRTSGLSIQPRGQVRARPRLAASRYSFATVLRALRRLSKPARHSKRETLGLILVAQNRIVASNVVFSLLRRKLRSSRVWCASLYEAPTGIQVMVVEIPTA